MMIDIHNHLLPGIDDGAETLEQSLEMVRLFLKNGYTGAICTSHYYPGKYEISLLEYEQSFKVLENELLKREIEFKMYPGNEIFLCPKSVDLLKKREIHSLNNGIYVLVELPFFSELHAATELIFQLQLEGFVVILAHCERYVYFQKDLSKLKPFMKMGCLIQVNLSSLRSSLETSRCLQELLQNKWVSFVATDAHSDKTERSPNVSCELEQLRSILSEDYYHRIVIENPIRVLKNQPIQAIRKRSSQKGQTKTNLFKKLFRRK